MPREKKNRAFPRIHQFLNELEWCTTRNYVEYLRGRGDLLEIDGVDVDVPQIVRRHFICDSQRCVQWSGEKPLVDRGCCCRYEVPLTTRDRRVVLEHLDAVRPNLPEGHRLLDPSLDPFQLDDDFAFEMIHDNPVGGCQFNMYIEGRCRCALHLTALQHNENPHDWKPLACSLWPLAINVYKDDDGGERLLLTVYCAENAELFDEAEEEPFACIIDQAESYPYTYQAERSALEHVFSPAWWSKLNHAAQELQRGQKKGKKH